MKQISVAFIDALICSWSYGMIFGLACMLLFLTYC